MLRQVGEGLSQNSLEAMLRNSGILRQMAEGVVRIARRIASGRSLQGDLGPVRVRRDPGDERDQPHRNGSADD